MNPLSRHASNQQTWVIENECPAACLLVMFVVEDESTLEELAQNLPLGLLCLKNRAITTID